MTANTPEIRTIATTVHGRYLIRRPASPGPFLWLLGFHGYREHAARHLEHLSAIPGVERWLIVSVQGLSRFYNAQSKTVVASWMTSQDRELAIADNVDYVNGVMADVERELGRPAAVVLAGFSQGVAMAFRAALSGDRVVDAVVALGGDVPPELTKAAPRAWPRVLVAAGTQDKFYTPAKVAADAAFFRAAGVDADLFSFEGGHEWTDAFARRAGELLAEVASKAFRNPATSQTNRERD
jgi:predicted esterase